MAAGAGMREWKRDLVTYDLLGDSPAIGTNSDFDLSFEVTSGWKTRFEPLNHETVPLSRAESQGFHDLLSGQGASGLELKLTGPAAPPCGRVPTAYASVCTLDKVKSALERAGRLSQNNPAPTPSNRKRVSDGARSSNTCDQSPSSSTSSITSSPSVKRRWQDEEGADGCDSSSESLTAAGCPHCLMYVLISKANPRCPRCGSPVAMPVPVPMLQKKPIIDLNFSL